MESRGRSELEEAMGLQDSIEPVTRMLEKNNGLVNQDKRYSRESSTNLTNAEVSSSGPYRNRRKSTRLRKDSKVNYFESPSSSPNSEVHSINLTEQPRKRRIISPRNNLSRPPNGNDANHSSPQDTGEEKRAKDDNEMSRCANGNLASGMAGQTKCNNHSWCMGPKKDETNKVEPRECGGDAELELASGSIIDAIGKNMVRRSSRIFSKQYTLVNPVQDPIQIQSNILNMEEAEPNSENRSVIEPSDDGDIPRRPGLRPRPRVHYGLVRDDQSTVDQAQCGLRGDGGGSYKLERSEEKYDRLRHLETFTGSHKNPNFTQMLSSQGKVSEEDEPERVIPLNARQLNGRGRGLLRKGRVTDLADIDPLAVSEEVNFSLIGGLDSHIQSLKEMVLLPLLYPEVYVQFSIVPPRGVLFYGPPGTGKTLVARALANSCSSESQKVAFFMRKGADCLSKWVGEAERQLRLLFEEAKAWQPSVIFFDEIDGLAPVRSSKQDQIHSSIVSTLLALMDGLDNRGQVVVIGATNRIDAIDPALRRPGRFDREFYFPLPNQVARRIIIDINTRNWSPPPTNEFKDHLALITKGYGGADLKALSTEAALRAIRRKYPQIYKSNDKLLIERKNIEVTSVDFFEAIKAIVPSLQRTSSLPTSPIPASVKVLLAEAWENALRLLDPLLQGCKGKYIPELVSNGEDFQECSSEVHYRPRILISGERGMGQIYLGPAILNHLEDLQIFSFDLANLFGDDSSAAETKCVRLFQEAKKHKPCVIYISSIDYWWLSATESLRNTFFGLLKSVNPYDPVILIATCDCPFDDLSPDLINVSDFTARKNIHLQAPSELKREMFFKSLIASIYTPFRAREAMTQEQAPPLPLAPKVEPKKPTEEESKLLKEYDEYIFRELRIAVRSITEELFKERKYKLFFKPMDPEEYPGYYSRISEPMDLSTIMRKINLDQYHTVNEFLKDIDLIVKNTELYFGPCDQGKHFYRVKSLEDVAYAMVERIDPELVHEAKQSAKRYYARLSKNQDMCTSDENASIGRANVENMEKTTLEPHNTFEAMTPVGSPPRSSNIELIKDSGSPEVVGRPHQESSSPRTIPVIYDPSNLLLLETRVKERTGKMNVEELDELRVKLYNILKARFHLPDRNPAIKDMLNEIEQTMAQIEPLENGQILPLY